MHVMMGWAALLVLATFMTVLLVVPGALIPRRSGLDPLVAVAAGPATTLVLVSAVSILLPLLHVPWVPVGPGLLVLGAALALLPRAPARGRHCASDPRLQRVSDPAALALIGRVALASLPGAIGGILVVAPALGRADAILQNHDAMFHLNVIARILRTGDASPISAVREISGGSFYPTAFHALVTTLGHAASVPLLLNAGLFAAGCIIAPMGAVVLARVCGAGWRSSTVAGLLSQVTMWSPTFTFFFHGHGPAGLGAVLVPWGVAALVSVRRSTASWSRITMMVTLVLAGSAVAHPGAGQWLLGALVVLLVSEWVTRRRAPSTDAPRLSTRGLVIATSVVVVSLGGLFFVPTLWEMGSFVRGDSRSAAETMGNALLLMPRGGPWTAALPEIILAGLGVLMPGGRRQVWLPLVLLYGAALCLVAGLGPDALRLLTAGWWSDPSRYLAAQAGLVSAAAALGCQRLLDGARRAVRTGPERVLRGAVVLVLVPAAAWWLAASGSADAKWVDRGYHALLHPAWVSTDEAADMPALGRLLPADSLVLGSPASGSGLLPLLAGVRTPYMTETYSSVSEPARYVARSFRNLLRDPEVCRSIHELGGVPYFYDDPRAEPDPTGDFRGFADVDTDSGFELVAVLDQARVYRVTACG